jgi:hypothetical protein
MYPNTVKLLGSFSSTSRSAIGGLINAQVRGTPGRLALLDPPVAGNMLLGEVQRHLDQGALARAARRRVRGAGAVRVNRQEPLCQLPPLTLNPAEPPFMGISPFFFNSFPFQL